MNLSTMVAMVALWAGPFCGDGNVDPGEDCLTCPEDVQCGACETCVGGVCLPEPLCTCGNGVPDPGETCETCADDVPCGPDELCKGGQCVLKCVPSAVTLDIVFVMDTSGSMGDEAADLCSEISGVQSELEALGLTVTVTLLGIAGNPGGPFECLTSNVNARLGSDLQLSRNAVQLDAQPRASLLRSLDRATQMPQTKLVADQGLSPI